MPCLWGSRAATADGQVSDKKSGVNPDEPLKLPEWSERGVGGMRSVAVECIDITQHSDCEGSVPALN